MSADIPAGRLPTEYLTAGLPSFTDFLRVAAPNLLPGHRPLPPGMAGDLAPHATASWSPATGGPRWAT